MRIVRQLVHSLWQFVMSWYAVDRIRISPTTGRLLQLKVGNRIVVGNSLFCVRKRRVVSSAEGYEVFYVLEQSQEMCELRVLRNEQNRNTGELIMASGSQMVFDADVNFVSIEPHSVLSEDRNH